MAKTRAKKIDKDLLSRVRSLGPRKSRVRKNLARRVADAVRHSPRSAPKAGRKRVGDLQGAVAEIQDRIRGGPEKRRAAAKKAARTRQARARKRSEAAKKGARTRAKSRA
jgi:hypothetical protein